MLIERRFLDISSPRISVDLPIEFANRRVELIILALDNTEPPVSSQPMTEHTAKALLAETSGAWGKRSAIEVEAMIEKHRQEDWGHD